jgi:hypothetical protein
MKTRPDKLPNKTRHVRHSRNGAVMVVALVCLVVVMALLGGMLQGALRARRQLHSERDRRQTELLLQAGLDRAAFRLTREPDYRGETWGLSAEEILGSSGGEVRIEASRSMADAPWEVSVAAVYRTGNEHSIQRSRTFTVHSQKPRTQE